MCESPEKLSKILLKGLITNGFKNKIKKNFRSRKDKKKMRWRAFAIRSNIAHNFLIY